MTRGFTTTHGRVGLAGAHHSKRADATCTTVGFYTGPTSGQTVDAGSPVNISWIASCISSSAVDIYLFAPGAATPLVHEWANVPNTAGSYMATLEPSWWNSSSSSNLQVSVVQSGTPVFLSPAPAGPIFTANSTNSTSQSSSTSDSAAGDVTDVQKLEAALKGMSPGAKAAAVLLPLLFVFGLAAAYYRKVIHTRAQEKTKRFSTAMDKRMSTMSVDWKPMSAAGANAAIRASMVGSNRASVFSFGALRETRPSSEFATDGGHAGVGSQGIYGESNNAFQPMSQLGSGPRPVSSAVSQQTRTSRISFATDTRPSVDRRTITSRAFHSAFVPPVPTRQDSGELSPTQTSGPLSLSQEDITARVSTGDEVDDYMPALNMMRTGGRDSSIDAEDYIIPRIAPKEDTIELPAPPTPSHASASNKPLPAMTPDEMLRAYAARSQIASPPGSPAPTFPSPVASNGGMRVLYSPATPTVPLTPVTVPGSVAREMHHAYAYSEDAGEDYEDAYGGTTH